MDCFTISMMSRALGKRTSLNLLVPAASGGPYKTLWALHGMTADHTSWTMESGIAALADKYGFCAVIPSADLSFYVDMVYGADYFTFLTRELPEYLARYFPISRRREDNILIGNSMGGYGAFEIGMRRPDLYATAVSLSGPMRIDWIHRVLSDPALAAACDSGDAGRVDREAREFAEAQGIPLFLVQSLMECGGSTTRRTFLAMFGNDPDALRGSEIDLMHLAGRLAESGNCPRLIARCGTGDLHYESNLLFSKYAAQIGLPYTLKTGAGRHDWDYWNPAIDEIIPMLFTGKS